MPPNRRAIVASAWVNDWNSWPMRSAGMPMPVSCTSAAIVQRSGAPGAGSGRPVTATDTSPVSVNFTAFDNRFSRICFTAR